MKDADTVTLSNAAPPRKLPSAGDALADVLEKTAIRAAEYALERAAETFASQDPLPVLLTSEQLARAISCSTVHVRKLTADGMPYILLGDAKRYELARVLEHLRKTTAAELAKATHKNNASSNNGETTEQADTNGASP